MAGAPHDPYPVSVPSIETVWSARPEQVRDILERAGFVLIEDSPRRNPLFRDSFGRSVTSDDINARADVDRALRYDLYQVWMDVTRQGY